MQKIVFFALINIVVFEAGCSRRQTVLKAQLCLTDPATVASVTEEMRAIATSEKIEFVDTSARTREGLQRIDENQSTWRADIPTLHVGIEKDNGTGLFASNLSLSHNQVGLDFIAGHDVEEGHEFAQRVIDRMSRLGRVKVVENERAPRTFEC